MARGLTEREYGRARCPEKALPRNAARLTTSSAAVVVAGRSIMIGGNCRMDSGNSARNGSVRDRDAVTEDTRQKKGEHGQQAEGAGVRG